MKNYPEILDWHGALGHTFITIEPDSSEHGKLYNGFRCCTEAGCIEHALIDFKEGQQIWQKLGKKKWKRVK